MKVMFINTVCGTGSTGRIVCDMLDTVKNMGGEGIAVYGYGSAAGIPEEAEYKAGGNFNYYFHNIMSRLTDMEGLFSKHTTKKLLKKIDEYQPDVIHLHNLHGHYINYEILFKYLSQKSIKIIWTLHDCWPITGHCAHFSYAGCDKWKSCCTQCPQKRAYPESLLISRAAYNFEKKKAAFCSVKDMTVVCPSNWLAGLVRGSFLGKFNVKVINNGIDLKVFKPHHSDFREKYELQDKKIVLGVSGEWSKKKGLEDFYKLTDTLSSDFAVVLVGLYPEQIEKITSFLPEYAELSRNDLSGRVFIPKENKKNGAGKLVVFEKTESQGELASIYSASDVFVNPTYEDTFPTVNLEALACGTPVVTYNTGGSPEALDDSCGIVVEQGNLEQLLCGVKNALSLLRENAENRAQMYDRKDRYAEYYALYCENELK